MLSKKQNILRSKFKMANITISNIDISESYISELNEQEIINIEGGFPWAELAGLVAAAVSFIVAL